MHPRPKKALTWSEEMIVGPLLPEAKNEQKVIKSILKQSGIYETLKQPNSHEIKLNERDLINHMTKCINAMAYECSPWLPFFFSNATASALNLLSKKIQDIHISESYSILTPADKLSQISRLLVGEWQAIITQKPTEDLPISATQHYIEQVLNPEPNSHHFERTVGLLIQVLLEYGKITPVFLEPLDLVVLYNLQIPMEPAFYNRAFARLYYDQHVDMRNHYGINQP